MPLHPGFSALARGSLSLLLMTPMAPGCLVSDPPLQEAPERTAPMLDLVRAQPLVTEVIVRDISDNLATNDRIEFSVPLRSEDAGEVVWYNLYSDYTFKGAKSLGVQNTMAPSTFDDTSRSITFGWTPDDSLSDGCHQLTLLASHASTWDTGAFRPDPVLSQGDVALATWWLNLNPPSDNPFTLPNCPNRAEVEQ